MIVKQSTTPPIQEYTALSLLKESDYIVHLEEIIVSYDPRIAKRHMAGSFFLILEPLEQTLHDYLKSILDMSVCRMLLIALEIAQALVKTLHEGIIHFDIKSMNILLTNDLHAKLADFGLSEKYDNPYLERSRIRLIGTPHIMAPELRSKKKFSFASDIFSYSKVLIELMTRNYNHVQYTPDFEDFLKDILPGRYTS